ncbi:YgfZ/GcvT domain-containing protein [Aquirhabdus sp.]|uniref:CAF17-like 4Fe-4S cluster assembly/insertion protein YgfZ n=1 Tax=Aquirhabdus sp. TaxID=2824160 RepID=UPI00396C5D27
MSAPTLSFSTLTLTGIDTEKFLQGQVTVDVTHISADEFRPTAICDLKGRIAFGLWLTRHSAEHIDIVIATDLLDSFKAHLRKYGAFSKMSASDSQSIFPAIADGFAVFQADETATTIIEWQKTAIATGAAWITANTAGLFQPQELRLHQRDGVNYDKGCYLGQEIVARLYFRAKPKAWLHRVEGSGVVPQAGQSIAPNITAVNAIATSNEGWEALVVAKPETLGEAGLVILDLPEALSGDVGR